jgi:hypothetical protein
MSGTDNRQIGAASADIPDDAKTVDAAAGRQHGLLERTISRISSIPLVRKPTHFTHHLF